MAKIDVPGGCRTKNDVGLAARPATIRTARGRHREIVETIEIDITERGDTRPKLVSSVATTTAFADDGPTRVSEPASIECLWVLAPQEYVHLSSVVATHRTGPRSPNEEVPAPVTIDITGGRNV
jgi:hypothetical protein